MAIAQGDSLLTRHNDELLYYYYPISELCMSITISKITRAGQVTLPKKLRDKAFADATAVVFEERGKEVVIRPVQIRKKQVNDNWHMPLVEYTMRDWLDPENDNLFELPKGI